MAIRILIADGNFLVREGLKNVIAGQKDMKCCGLAVSGEEMIVQAAQLQPDLIIVDHLGVSFGAAVVRKTRSVSSANILSISDKPLRRVLNEAMDAGVTSYLLRDCERDEIFEAIRATAKGEKFFCGKIVSEVMQSTDEAAAPDGSFSCDGIKISAREAEIIRLVAEGLTNKEIADRLFLSAHTVTTHRKNIMAKLNVNNTAGLVLYAIRNNIVSPNRFLFNTN